MMYTVIPPTLVTVGTVYNVGGRRQRPLGQEGRRRSQRGEGDLFFSQFLDRLTRVVEMFSKKREELKRKTIMFVNLCKNVVAFMTTYGRKNIIMNKCLTYPKLCLKKKEMKIFFHN